MNTNTEYYIPRHLDEPERFLFWSIEEGIAMLFPLIFGIISEHALLGIAFSILGFMGVRKMIKSNGQNIAQYVLYWHFPQNTKSYKWLPASFIREYLG